MHHRTQRRDAAVGRRVGAVRRRVGAVLVEQHEGGTRTQPLRTHASSGRCAVVGNAGAAQACWELGVGLGSGLGVGVGRRGGVIHLRRRPSPISPIYLPYISPTSRLHLPYISPVSPPYFPSLRRRQSPISPLYLPYISPISPPYLPGLRRRPLPGIHRGRTAWHRHAGDTPERPPG